MSKIHIGAAIILMALFSYTSAEEFTLVKPDFSEGKYQEKISRCVEEEFSKYVASLSLVSRITKSDEQLETYKNSIHGRCSAHERYAFEYDLREYEKQRHAFELKRAEEARIRKQEAEAAERARQAQETALRQAEQVREAAAAKQAKEEADLLESEANAWKKYVFWGLVVVLVIAWKMISASLHRKRNEEIRQQVEIDMADLEENLEIMKRNMTATFDNRDNISGYGSFVWADYDCTIYGRKDVTVYKSASANYSRTGSKRREGNTTSGRGRISVGGTRGRYEKVDEEVCLGQHNLYVTTGGLYLCGNAPEHLKRSSIMSFRMLGGSAIQIIYSGAKYPIELYFSDWGKAKVFYNAMQNM